MHMSMQEQCITDKQRAAALQVARDGLAFCLGKDVTFIDAVDETLALAFTRALMHFGLREELQKRGLAARTD